MDVLSAAVVVYRRSSPVGGADCVSCGGDMACHMIYYWLYLVLQ